VTCSITSGVVSLLIEESFSTSNSRLHRAASSGGRIMAGEVVKITLLRSHVPPPRHCPPPEVQTVSGFEPPTHLKEGVNARDAPVQVLEGQSPFTSHAKPTRLPPAQVLHEVVMFPTKPTTFPSSTQFGEPKVRQNCGKGQSPSLLQFWFTLPLQPLLRQSRLKKVRSTVSLVPLVIESVPNVSVIRSIDPRLLKLGWVEPMSMTPVHVLPI
jgi:hypothetical protein